MATSFRKLRNRLRRRTRQVKPWAAFSLAALVALIAFLAWRHQAKEVMVALQEPAPPASYTKVGLDPDEPADARSEVAGRWYGLCEKNVVRTVEDFKRIVYGDPLLLKHFDGFNWAGARLGRNEETVWTYLAYRKGDTVFSTTKKVKLPMGDGFISDGFRKVRTYCCNDYIETVPPVEEVAEVSISTGASRQLSSGARRLIITQLSDYFAPAPITDRSDPPIQTITMLTSSTDTFTTGSGRPPRWLWYPGDSPVRPPSISTFVRVAEPSALLLTGLGITFLGICRRCRSRKKSSG